MAIVHDARVLAVAVLLGGAARPQGPAPHAITEASIRGHMEFLASDAMNGRGSGTDDEWRAVTYVGSQMRRWGIEPLGDDGGFVQRIATGRDLVSAPPRLGVGEEQLRHGGEMLVLSLGRGAASGPLVTFRGAEVPEGAFVLVPEGASPDDAMLAGAAGVLTLETPEQRAGWDDAGARLPAARGGRRRGPRHARIVLSRAAFARVAALADGAAVTFSVPTRPGYTWNAIGRLTGSDPEAARDVVLLSAHIDHLGQRDRGPGEDGIYNGADDDASGSTAVLELCEAIARGPRPRRTAMFVWFGSEESGGAGARHFLAEPPVPLERIVANLEFEMIGRPDEKVPPHTLWLTGFERSDLGTQLVKQGARLVADPHPEQRFFYRSDNIQLARQGVIAQTVSSFNLHRDYHQPSDEIERIDFAHMTEAVQSMLAPVLWLANTDFRPSWAPDGRPR